MQQSKGYQEEDKAMNNAGSVDYQEYTYTSDRQPEVVSRPVTLTWPLAPGSSHTTRFLTKHECITHRPEQGRRASQSRSPDDRCPLDQYPTVVCRRSNS